MKLSTIIIYILLSFSLIACINNKTPLQVDDDSSEVLRPDNKKRTVTVYGYGYMKGKSKMAVERFAINMARGSIAEQAKGSRFTLEIKNNELLFSSDTGDVNLGGIETVTKDLQQQGDEWEMYVIQKAKVDIVIPGEKKVIVKDIHGEDEDIFSLVSLLKGRAISDAVKEHRELRTSDKISGHLYLSYLEVFPPTDGTGVSADIRFFIIFD